MQLGHPRAERLDRSQEGGGPLRLRVTDVRLQLSDPGNTQRQVLSDPGNTYTKMADNSARTYRDRFHQTVEPVEVYIDTGESSSTQTQAQTRKDRRQPLVIEVSRPVGRAGDKARWDSFLDTPPPVIR